MIFERYDLITISLILSRLQGIWWKFSAVELADRFLITREYASYKAIN